MRDDNCRRALAIERQKMMKAHATRCPGDDEDAEVGADGDRTDCGERSQEAERKSGLPGLSLKVSRELGPMTQPRKAIRMDTIGAAPAPESDPAAKNGAAAQ